MPEPLTYAAITLLARDRIAQIRDALEAKKRNGTAREIELQILYLARNAHQMMSITQPSIEPPVRLYGPPLTDQVSKFALLGAVGPEIPKYSAMFVNGHEWLFNTIHKGNPDVSREKVLVHSTDFVFEFWRQVQPLIDQEFSKADDRSSAGRNMQAYLLGHLCHVAADVVSHPYYDDVASHLGIPNRPRLDREQVASTIETAIASKFFGRGVKTRGKEWSSWWPDSRDVPKSFYQAYQAALVKQFGSGARPAGFREFEEAFAALSPPAPELSLDLLKDGFSKFRNIVEIGKSWDLLDWLGATVPMFLPAFLAMPLAAVLTQANDLSREVSDEQKAIRTYEEIVFPFVATAIAPVVSMILVSLNSFGIGKELITGWVSAGVGVLAAVGFFATLGGAGPARWILFFVIPLAMELIHLFYTLSRSGSDNRHWQLALSTIVHIVMSLLFLLSYSSFLHKGVEALAKNQAGDFIELLVIWFGIVLVGWFVNALLWRYVFGAGVRDDAASEFATNRGHYIRLFDDTTLYRDPQGPSPTLDNLYFPSGRRKLLKLWWDGPAAPALTVRSNRDRLVFRFMGAAPNKDQTIFVSSAPTKASEFADFLNRSIKDNAGNANKHLQAKVVYSADLDYELPPGEVFSDHGDDQSTQSDHDTEVAKFKSIGTKEDDAFILFHAPKTTLSVAFDRNGPALTGDGKNDAASVAGSAITTVVATPIRISATPGSFLTRLFRSGDAVQTTVAPIQTRIVVSVDSDTQITVSTPFSPVLPPAGVSYKRFGQDRSVDQNSPAGSTIFTAIPAVGIGSNDVSGSAGTVFGSIFKPGDVVRINPPGPAQSQTRKVVSVVNDTQMTLDEPLNPAIAVPGAAFVRVADEIATGFDYVADADDTLFTGDSVMNHAADLAALLCVAGASRLFTDQQLSAPGNTPPPNLKKAYQVFRNWNLDRRRENEWKMLIFGDAVSEKRGDATAADPAAPVESGWSLLTADGEPIANKLGWVPLLRSWLDMAKRPGTDATASVIFRPGNMSNRELSQALAFLFDMRDPVAP